LKIPLCKITDIPDEGAKTIPFLDREILALKIEGEPKAVVNICMHLGGTLYREGNRLVCQSHHSEFDCLTGQCLGGPAHPASRLLILPTEVENGVLTYATDFDCRRVSKFDQILPQIIHQIEKNL
jgi:nitrite reductase/ring-hydroxylating ferredoxin subunit